MKKIIALVALVAFTFAVQAGEGCGSKCPASGKGDKAKSEGTSPASGEKKADDKKA